MTETAYKTTSKPYLITVFNPTTRHNPSITVWHGDFRVCRISENWALYIMSQRITLPDHEIINARGRWAMSPNTRIVK